MQPLEGSLPLHDPSGVARWFNISMNAMRAHRCFEYLAENLVDFCSPVLYFRGSSPASEAIRFPASVVNELASKSVTKVMLLSEVSISNALNNK